MRVRQPRLDSQLVQKQRRRLRCTWRRIAFLPPSLSTKRFRLAGQRLCRCLLTPSSTLRCRCCVGACSRTVTRNGVGGCSVINNLLLRHVRITTTAVRTVRGRCSSVSCRSASQVANASHVQVDVLVNQAKAGRLQRHHLGDRHRDCTYTSSVGVFHFCNIQACKSRVKRHFQRLSSAKCHRAKRTRRSVGNTVARGAGGCSTCPWCRSTFTSIFKSYQHTTVCQTVRPGKVDSTGWALTVACGHVWLSTINQQNV